MLNRSTIHIVINADAPIGEDISTLSDIRDIKIDTNLPKEQRIVEFALLIVCPEIENYAKEVSSISAKRYELIVPEQVIVTTKVFEASMENAILLALLEQKYITLWQYEQCCAKLRLPTAGNATTLKR